MRVRQSRSYFHKQTITFESENEYYSGYHNREPASSSHLLPSLPPLTLPSPLFYSLITSLNSSFHSPHHLLRPRQPFVVTPTPTHKTKNITPNSQHRNLKSATPKFRILSKRDPTPTLSSDPKNYQQTSNTRLQTRKENNTLL